MDVLLAGDHLVIDGAAAVELLHLVSCLPASVFNPEIFSLVPSHKKLNIISVKVKVLYLPPEAWMMAERTCILGKTLGVR